MNTYEYEYNTVETYEHPVLHIDLLDSGLVQLKEKIVLRKMKTTCKVLCIYFQHGSLRTTD
jgi:hypothetical protein